MIIWNINRLIAELKSGEVTQKNRMYYLLSIIMIALVVGAIPTDETPPKIKYIESAIEIVGTAMAILVSYNANRKGDDKDYVERFICLTLPIVIKIAVGFVIYYTAYYLLGPIIMGESFKKFSENTSVLDIIVDMVAYGYFIILMTKSIRKTAILNA
jgi:hypothetical protein